MGVQTMPLSFPAVPALTTELVTVNSRPPSIDMPRSRQVLMNTPTFDPTPAEGRAASTSLHVPGYASMPLVGRPPPSSSYHMGHSRHEVLTPTSSNHGTP